MGTTFVVALLAACAALLLGVAPLRAQVPTGHPDHDHDHDEPLHALALNELDFGTVFPGIPASVSASDPHHAGLFQVTGPKGASVRVEFVLPGALAAGGALLPLAFGPRDGYADFSRGRPPRGLSFDPHAPVIGSLGPNGSLYLRLGGTALPERTQPGGEYRATIFMTVYDVGN
jgi:hypothetical protein